MKGIKTILTALLLTTLVQQAFSQFKGDDKFRKREVTINTNDSTVVFNILLDKGKNSIENELVYFWYLSGRIHKNRGGYGGHLLDGVFQSYGEEKHLIVQGEFHQGLKNGVWKVWYENGEYKRIEEWRKGRIHGKIKYFSDAGELISIVNYKNGYLHGDSIAFESVEKRVKYRKGTRVQQNSLFQLNKILPKKRDIKNNTPETEESTSDKNKPEEVLENEPINHEKEVESENKDKKRAKRKSL